MVLSITAGCAGFGQHYVRVDQDLVRGDSLAADHVIEKAEPEYGAKSRLLYRMDRGMTLHLSEKYDRSNQFLEQADREVEDGYTKRIRTETKAFLVNDNELPYEGDPQEQVMINVIKALNYAAMGKWSDALIEGRRIDHRLDLLADRTNAKDGYRDDGFARYLSGMLYEVNGDLNNAFISYRNAYEAYRKSRSWSKTSVPASLPADLLRTSEALHFTDEHQEYRRTFADTEWRPISETRNLAQLLVISYNGRAPYKDDLFIDLPVSMEALNLVLINRGINQSHRGPQSRAADSALYGLSGSVVRVALPKLVPQKTQTAFTEVTLVGGTGTYSGRTELVENVTATAEKTLADRFAGIALKAVARAAVKHALAQGAMVGTQAAMGKNNDAGPWVALLVGVLGNALAVYSEEADKRSWRTLPDEIQLTRLWVPPGTYQVKMRPVGRGGANHDGERVRALTLREGDTMLLVDRVMQ